MRCTVIVCSRGRPAILEVTICSVLAQTQPAHAVILSLVDRTDATEPTLVIPGVMALFGSAGLTVQRNHALAHLPADTDLVVFLDDDVIIRRDFLAAAARLFGAHPDIAIATGLVIAKGHEDDKVSLDEAQDIIDEDERTFDVRAAPLNILDVPNAVGCDMCLSARVARQVRFDERLRHYGWLEDMDFSIVCRTFGRVVKTDTLRLVHLRTPAGRMANPRIGFSQIMNPYYLYRKGTFSRGLQRMLVNYWGKVLVSNLLSSLPGRGGPSRRGRLRGNLMAFSMILRGRVEPEAIEQIPLD